MALLVLEGFDNYNLNADIRKAAHLDCSIYDSRATTDTTYTYGASSSKSINLDDTNTWLRISLPYSISGGPIFFGAAIRPRATKAILGFPVAADSSYIAQMGFGYRIDGAGAVVMSRGDSSDTVLGQSSITLPTHQWSYIECEMFVHNSNGYGKFWIDGELVIDVSGVNTQYRPTDEIFAIVVYGYAHYDDIYICDGTGTKNNSRLGIKKVNYLFAENVGNSSDWTPSAGDNYECIADEGDIDDDTTYVTTATLDDIDTYAMQDMSLPGGDILGLGIGVIGRVESGSGTIKTVARVGGTDYPTSGELLFDSTDYVGLEQYLEDNPAGGNWSEAIVNSGEYGIKRIS